MAERRGEALFLSKREVAGKSASYFAGSSRSGPTHVCTACMKRMHDVHVGAELGPATSTQEGKNAALLPFCHQLISPGFGGVAQDV